MGKKLIPSQHKSNAKEFEKLTEIASHEFVARVETNKKT